MESVKEKLSKSNEKRSKDEVEKGSNWTELLTQVVENLTGKDLAITYEFDNLEIDVPKATGPGGKEIGSAKWKIDGKIVISTNVEDKSASLE